jgi:hypothetical protein
MADDSTGASVIALAPPPTIDAQRRKAAADILQELLADAKAGKIVDLLVLYESDRGTYVESTTMVDDVARRIGMLEMLKMNTFLRLRLPDCAGE